MSAKGFFCCRNSKNCKTGTSLFELRKQQKTLAEIITGRCNESKEEQSGGTIDWPFMICILKCNVTGKVGRIFAT